MYSPNNIEPKWQKAWLSEGIFNADDASKLPKSYILDMFPYPSADGLHVGHPEGYTATDIYSRYLRAKGYEVLRPMGWDAFGLPAENFAIKKGIHPRETTEASIANFRRQIQSFGFSYDWTREINTSSPEYYKWTQWLFLELFKKGLAYKKFAPVNWCEHCHTVLANEQVIGGACERCKNPVIQKELSQWFFKVTDYADELLSGLDSLDWPENIKAMQRNWIGKSEGLIFSAPVKDMSIEIRTFSAHFEACYADTFVAIAPDHSLLPELVAGLPNAKEILDFSQNIVNERAVNREEPEPTGIFTGRYIVNPLDGKELPIWVASFAMAQYGTGIVKCSAHDERDFAFAKKYQIPLKVCLLPTDPTEAERVRNFEYCYSDTQHGVLTEPAEFAGKNARDSRQDIATYCQRNSFAQPETIYRLRDWLVSRQRYWGTPIPIIICDTCGVQAVPEIDLPVLLPEDVDFLPTGESPLARSASFSALVACPNCGNPAQREVDTMDTFVCSSWYYLRYTSPNDADCPFTKEAIDHWLPVSLCVGGAEHAVLHLLYARFVAKALRDMGFLSFDEPFTRLKNQGMILGEDGEKMSKSRGNVINPDSVVEQYGADTVRLYEMFMGPFSDQKPWSTQSIIGSRRFIEKVWTIVQTCIDEQRFGDESAHITRDLHKTIKKVTEDIESFSFNTAISTMMIFSNTLQKELQVGNSLQKETLESFLIILSSFAPHVAEELWSQLAHSDFIARAPWPSYDPALAKDELVMLMIQVNGKTRDHFEAAPDMSQEDALAQALTQDAVKKYTQGKEIKKVVFVLGRLLNIVID